jgi:hypothetical protein
MSIHRKNLNLQEDTGETFKIALADDKTVIANSTGPLEIQTTKLCVKNGVNSELVDVVSTINNNTNNISTAVDNRIAAINKLTDDRTDAINTLTDDRIAAINKLTADRTDAIIALSTVINNNKTGGDDNNTELSNELNTVQSSITAILDNSVINLDSFQEIVAAYEAADTGLQGFIDGLTTRLTTAENIVNTLTLLPVAPIYTGLRALFQSEYNGSYGYFNIKMVGTTTENPNYLYMESGGALTVYARPAPTSEGLFGISHLDNSSNPDEHVWKVTKVSGTNLFTIENTAYPGQYIGQYGSVSGSTAAVASNDPPQLLITESNPGTTVDEYHMTLQNNSDSAYRAYWYVINELYHYVDFQGLNNLNYDSANISFKFEAI